MTSARPPFSDATYDRAALHRSDQDWLAEAWTRARVVPVSPKSAVPVTADCRVAFRDAADATDGVRRFLGLVGEVAYFTVTTEPDGDNWTTLREFGLQADELDAGLVVSAIALEQWHQRHTHCPRCGALTVETQAGWTRTCTNDGSEHFPRTDPAVIMLVHDGADRTLLGRGPQWGEGRFSTLAGFVEPGESLEAAVTREVFEEVGIGVRDVRYLASQPWPFPASLMIGFFARLDGDASITLDPVEMAEAAWFTRDEVADAARWTDEQAQPDPSRRLRGISPKLSISRFLIDQWLDGAR
ncbi:MAG: NAD(+) diphosphatase [Jatrophihabitans sp.]|uniref:NAD(+) diphosphatase n=1 Tax=Jatrophihabitans sp. TaxID=1932789 RepID=UPI0039169039